jgi:hypothetical protein
VKEIIRCHHRGEIHVLPLLQEFCHRILLHFENFPFGGVDSTAEPPVPSEGITPLGPLDNGIFLLYTNFNRFLVSTIYKLDFPIVK